MRTEQRREIAVSTAARYGQAPTWDAATDTLLWVDTPARLVHRFRPGGENHTMEVPQAVSAAKPRSHGGLVLHLDEGVALFESNQQQRTWLAYWAREGFHGGATAVDSGGRLWAATVPATSHQQGTGTGWLVRVEPGGAARAAVHGVAGGSGIAFSPDNSLLYLVDGSSVDAFDFDVATGQLTGRGQVCTVAESEGAPAGLCVDAEGYLWVPIRYGGEIRRYTPDGALDRSVPLPARRPTDCCFGGPDLTDLYVTTACDGTEAEPTQGTANADGSLLVLPGIGEGLRTPAFAG